MVKICSKEYPLENDEKYATYFQRFPYPLSPFQKHALEAIVEGHHVLVTAHTGSGKTLPAEFAIQHFVGLGKKLIYTSPIKALSNQKYYEFTKKYPEISFGLLTGDIKTNPDADVLIMTTEILMNYLFMGEPKEPSIPLPNSSPEFEVGSGSVFAVGSGSGFELGPGSAVVTNNKSNLQFNIDVHNELGCVVFDEVHYINDKERGQVWEKTILMLPPHIQMVLLSATIDNPAGFAEWIENRHIKIEGPHSKHVALASTNHRVVPLSHYGFLTTTEAIFKAVRDKTTQKMIRDTTNTLIPLQDHNGGFQDTGYRNIVKVRDILDNNYVDMKRKNVLNQLALFLRDRDMLPAIAFVFSRKHVELCAKDITVPLLEDDSKVGYTVRRECEQIVRKLPNYQEYLQLPEYNQVVSLLEKGIGIHHSGMIPILREIVELMISKKYIKLLFATESFAIGLDCPIRTAIFTSLTKFDGNGERYLLAHEYTQMAGRAGRRGIDTVGHVVHCNNLFNIPSLTDYKTMLGGVPQKLVSKFHISYGLILNLLKNGKTTDFHKFSEKSMITLEIANSIDADKREMEDLAIKLNKKLETIKMNRTPKQVCERYIELETLCKQAVNKKRKEIEREMDNSRNEYRTLLEDVKKVKELWDMDTEYHKLKDSIEYMEQYVYTQTQNICKIMSEEGVINDLGDSIYELTAQGKIAANIAEVHPLPISKKMCDNAYFADFTPKQLVGLFSCFTDVKIPSDQKYSIPITEDKLLKQTINDLIGMYKNYESKEFEVDLHTGINYENALVFDMVDYSMSWCDCQTEEECKYFIQSVISEKEISIGDFTKAMMKIVTISKELFNIAETLGAIDLMYKLNQIDGMVLKYVLTSQSLYV
jgi:superfamily II RNA helicase